MRKGKSLTSLLEPSTLSSKPRLTLFHPTMGNIKSYATLYLNVYHCICLLYRIVHTSPKFRNPCVHAVLLSALECTEDLLRKSRHMHSGTFFSENIDFVILLSFDLSSSNFFIGRYSLWKPRDVNIIYMMFGIVKLVNYHWKMSLRLNISKLQVLSVQFLLLNLVNEREDMSIHTSIVI